MGFVEMLVYVLAYVHRDDSAREDLGVSNSRDNMSLIR